MPPYKSKPPPAIDIHSRDPRTAIKKYLPLSIEFSWRLRVIIPLSCSDKFRGASISSLHPVRIGDKYSGDASSSHKSPAKAARQTSLRGTAPQGTDTFGMIRAFLFAAACFFCPISMAPGFPGGVYFWAVRCRAAEQFVRFFIISEQGFRVAEQRSLGNG